MQDHKINLSEPIYLVNPVRQDSEAICTPFEHSWNDITQWNNKGLFNGVMIGSSLRKEMEIDFPTD
jgi:hypothetical protein